MKPSQSTDSRWYKEPIVLLMLGLLGGSMTVVMYFVFTAVKHGDTVVRDNYYKEGLAINQELRLDEQAKLLGVQLDINFDRNTKIVTAKLIHKAPSVDFLKLELIHPTLKEQDQSILLQRNQNGVYIGPLKDYIDGSFHIHVSSPVQKWRVRDRFTLGEQTKINMNTLTKK